ncbi:MAG TPA: 2-dehydropantoate 2-reductase [Candidatus Polarisedimenticolaceae bacterium]
MRIAILGAGGVGGYYGARLAAAGHDVWFLARGEHAATMRRSGLRVRSELGDLRLERVAVFGDPAEVATVQLLIVAVKLGDTASILPSIPALLGAEGVVLSLQNGVDKDDALVDAAGAGRVLGAVTYILANRPEPGVIVHTGKVQRIVVGELGGGESDRVRRVVEVLSSAGIDAVASPDIRRATWEKFVFLASVSGMTAATRATIGEVRAHPATRALLRDAMLEIAALARAEGVAIDDAFVDDRMRFVDTLPAEGRSSMANDLLRGAPLEIEWLSGAVVRRGERAGVPTPVHRGLHAALALHAQGTRSPSAGSDAAASTRRQSS